MGELFKVAIIGSGPAGLSAAARAAALGLSHVLLEKTDHLSDTIYKYQKGKHVMATPSNLVLRSDIDFDAGKRETILGLWDEQIAALSDRFRVIAVDLPGHGQSPALAGEPLMADYADTVTDALAPVFAGRAIFVGLSFGSK